MPEISAEATPQHLACTRCGSPVAVCETVEGFIDWGIAVVGTDGVVRPQTINPDPPAVMADNGRTTGAYAVCDNRDCGHRWKLRRRFDATPTPEGSDCRA